MYRCRENHCNAYRKNGVSSHPCIISGVSLLFHSLLSMQMYNSQTVNIIMLFALRLGKVIYGKTGIAELT